MTSGIGVRTEYHRWQAGSWLAGVLNSLVALVVSFAVVGCDSPSEQSPRSGDEPEPASGQQEPEKNSEPSKPRRGRIQHKEGPAPAPETVLAKAGELEVTLREYERFMRQSRLFAPAEQGSVPEIPRLRQANPRLQTQSLRSLLKQEIIMQTAVERGIEASNEEVESYIREHEKLGRFVGDGEARELDLPEGFSRSDLREVARAELLKNKVRAALLAALDRDDLWRMYRRRKDTARIAYVSVENTPTPDEIERLVGSDDPSDRRRISEYFEKHQSRYRMPRLVKLAVVKPEPGTEIEESKLERAAKLLSEGGAAAEVASELELKHETQAFLVRQENPEAFGAEKGETGWETEGPRGAYAWRVEGWRESETAQLERGLRREVAADLLRETVVTSARRKLQPVLEAMRRVDAGEDGIVSSRELKPVEEVTRGSELKLVETKPFSSGPQPTVEGLGLAKRVAGAAFELDASSRVVDEPVLSRGRAVAMMLLERDRPRREEFESQYESFREKVLAEQKKVVLDHYVSDWLSEHEPELDVEPLHIKYGVLKKK